MNCLKCGRCCHVVLPNGKVKRCGYLTRDYKCKIYANRLGTPICKGWHCDLAANSRFNYKNCPFNREDKTFIDVGY